MSFVANPPAPNIPTVADDQVDGDRWWPGFSIADFRASARIPEAVTAIRVRDALVGAMISADVELAAWRAAREAEGHDELAAVPGPELAGEKRAVLLHRRAVYAYAAADLAETHSDIGATQHGRDRREERASSADEHRRNATVAIRDLRGAGRSKVALV